LRVNSTARKTAKFGGLRINHAIKRASMKSRPRPAVGMVGVRVTDRGRPYTGVRIREGEAKNMSRVIGKHMQREVSKGWRT